jgi:hypothetical protein
MRAIILVSFFLSTFALTLAWNEGKKGRNFNLKQDAVIGSLREAVSGHKEVVEKLSCEISSQVAAIRADSEKSRQDISAFSASIEALSEKTAALAEKPDEPAKLRYPEPKSITQVNEDLEMIRKIQEEMAAKELQWQNDGTPQASREALRQSAIEQIQKIEASLWVPKSDKIIVPNYPVEPPIPQNEAPSFNPYQDMKKEPEKTPEPKTEKVSSKKKVSATKPKKPAKACAT